MEKQLGIYFEGYACTLNCVDFLVDYIHISVSNNSIWESIEKKQTVHFLNSFSLSRESFSLSLKNCRKCCSESN